MARLHRPASSVGRSRIVAITVNGHVIQRHVAALLATLCLLLGSGALTAQVLPQRINDSGQLDCYNDSQSPPDFCNHSAWPGQDGSHGREQAAAQGQLSKVGAGAQGFDFSKLSASGNVVPVDAAPGDGPWQWACTRDNVTGLVWRITSEGGLSWYSARHRANQFAAMVGQYCGIAGWRLPTSGELIGIVHHGNELPAVDGAYFPNTEHGPYWASDRPALTPDQAFAVSFDHGYAHGLDVTRASAALRLVAGGGSYGDWVDHGDGTVTDPGTGLMWDRCSLGQTGTACQGTATSMTWQEALLQVQVRNQQNWHGHSDWRLPNIKELTSLRAIGKGWPSLDTTLFPGTDPGVYWSATSMRHQGQAAWGVFFGEGNVFAVIKHTLARVRLVRTAQASAGIEPPTALFADDFEAAERAPQPPTGSLPLLTISTTNGEPIQDRETYVNAQLTISGSDPKHSYQGDMGIRGRGNSTWAMPKKPYRLRLDNASPLLGMPSNRHWVLLANYADKSLLRNHLALDLGWSLGMAWNPRTVTVRVRLNGNDVGIYQLVEHIRIGSHRVDIAELEPEDTDPVSITGGYLMEIDHRRDCEANVQFDTTRGVPICIDTPDDESIVPAQYTYIRDYVRQTEDVLYGAGFSDPATGYAAWLDPVSYIDYFLVAELMMNQDMQGFSSIWTYKDRGGRLQRGPLWDFDIGAGNIDYGINADPRGWWIRNGPWYQRLFEDPAFAQAVRNRWDGIRDDLLDDLTGEMRVQVTRMGAAVDQNFNRWPILHQQTWPNAVLTGSHSGEIAYLTDWLRQRIAWLDANL